ncbi:hypothetical protein ACOMXT_001735 [Providencia rettgeri]
MEFKHSPAPWNYNGNVCGAVEPPTDGLIACVYPMHYENAEEMKANAHLISAAPELLESLRELVSAMERYEIDVGESAPVKHKEMMNKAKASIAKALGQQ